MSDIVTTLTGTPKHEYKYFGHKIGEAIQTPSGVEVWGHDFEETPGVGEYLPTYLDVVDDFESAGRMIENHVRQRTS